MLTPFEGQQVILDSDIQFRVVSKGRRWGGTALCVLAAIQEATIRRQKVIMVCHSHSALSHAWRILCNCVHQHPQLKRLDNTAKTLTFFTEGRIWLTVDSWKMRGMITPTDSVIVDEAAYCSEDAWQTIYATIKEKGRALLVSTPNGRNWFWIAYMSGLDWLAPNWLSWRMPTHSNPYADITAAQFTERWEREAFYLGKFAEPEDLFSDDEEQAKGE